MTEDYISKVLEYRDKAWSNSDYIVKQNQGIIKSSTIVNDFVNKSKNEFSK